jgi:hypothetical protein
MAIPAGGHSRPQLFSGARGQLKVNGQIIAFVTDVNVNIQANVRAIHTFGAPNARSVEPLSYSANVTIGRVIPVNKPDGTAVDTSTTSAAFAGIEPVINQMLLAEDVTVSLVDSLTSTTVAEVRNCRFAGRTMNLSAQQIANERIQLVGIFDAKNNTDDGIGL